MLSDPYFFLTPIFVGLCYEDVAVPTRKSMTVERLNNLCVLSVEHDLTLRYSWKMYSFSKVRVSQIIEVSEQLN